MPLYQFLNIDRTSAAFRRELVALAKRLGTDPNYLAAVMQNESGFDPAARNPMGGATGLIQFMPSTAARLGTTTDDLARMSDVEQLKYVERFYQPHAGKIASAGIAYMFTFLPAFAVAPDSKVLGRKNDSSDLGYGLTYGKVYEYNPGFDRDGDGEFTVGDVKSRAESTYMAAQARGPLDLPSEPAPDEGPARKAGNELATIVGFVVVGVALWRIAGALGRAYSRQQ